MSARNKNKNKPTEEDEMHPFVPEGTASSSFASNARNGKNITLSNTRNQIDINKF